MLFAQQFMNSKCPAEWEDKYVSSELSLKKGNDWHLSTTGCEGSGGMTDCILGNAGSIGYIDSGHGWSEGLKEVNVQNEDGFYLTSRFAHENQGIANAALAGNAPNSTTADWGGTNFLNKVCHSFIVVFSMKETIFVELMITEHNSHLCID
jgi:hypothetical protein